MKISLQRLTPTATLPQKMTEHSSGFDLFADILEPVTLAPLERKPIPSGIAIEIPEGYEAQIRPRSGLSITLGLSVVNSPGTIDADYRGEIRVLLINLGKEPIRIEPQMRIAQIVFCPIIIPELVETTMLSASLRQDGGFGHTGQ